MGPGEAHGVQQIQVWGLHQSWGSSVTAVSCGVPMHCGERGPQVLSNPKRSVMVLGCLKPSTALLLRSLAPLEALMLFPSFPRCV